MTWTSPSATRSQTERRERAMSRWISWVRPESFPFAASRRHAPPWTRAASSTPPSPSPCRTPHPGRDPILHGGRAEHLGATHRDQHRSGGEDGEVPLQAHRASSSSARPSARANRGSLASLVTLIVECSSSLGSSSLLLGGTPSGNAPLRLAAPSEPGDLFDGGEDPDNVGRGCDAEAAPGYRRQGGGPSRRAGKSHSLSCRRVHPDWPPPRDGRAWGASSPRGPRSPACRFL